MRKRVKVKVLETNGCKCGDCGTVVFRQSFTTGAEARAFINRINTSDNLGPDTFATIYYEEGDEDELS